jgi:tRNA G18 (ribose-2'-O)-methylase SpoU
LQFSVFEDTSEAIKSARSQGYVIAALEQHTGSTPLHTFKAPAKLALVLGNEVKGIARQTINDCDVILEIPMFGKKESLNVSITAAIAMYSLRFGVK